MSSSDPLRGLPPDMRARYDEIITNMVMDPTGRELVNPALVRFPRDDQEAYEAAEVLLRTAAGLDIKSAHGQETPRRFVEMLRELTTRPEIKWKTFPNDGVDEMIVTKRIPFVSLCSHHVIPFMGTASIGYIPDQHIAGLSKFARVVQHYAKGLQVQEQLTKEVADFLEEHLKPLGVAVAVEAEHLCMTIRGAQVPGATTYTAAMRGRFADHTKTAKAEFLAQINGSHK